MSEAAKVFTYANVRQEACISAHNFFEKKTDDVIKCLNEQYGLDYSLWEWVTDRKNIYFIIFTYHNKLSSNFIAWQ